MCKPCRYLVSSSFSFQRCNNNNRRALDYYFRSLPPSVPVLCFFCNAFSRREREEEVSSSRKKEKEKREKRRRRRGTLVFLALRFGYVDFTRREGLDSRGLSTVERRQCLHQSFSSSSKERRQQSFLLRNKLFDGVIFERGKGGVRANRH